MILKNKVKLHINQLIIARDKLRSEQEFDEADIIKKELDKLGIEVSDKKGKSEYKFKRRIPAWVVDWDYLVQKQLNDDYVSTLNLDYFAKQAINGMNE